MDNNEKAILALAKHIQRLERKIDLLLKERSATKVTWVKASKITELTGWNNEGMYKARMYGYLEYKKENGKFLYNLDSLNERLIKRKCCTESSSCTSRAGVVT